MTNNLGNFDRQAAEASRRVVQEAEEAFRGVALSAYHDLQTPALEAPGPFGAPVASGRLASSMRLGINAIDHSTAPADPDYNYAIPLPPRTIPNNPISRVSAALRRFRLGDTIYLSNSVPSIRRIEIGRHSWQTPDGVFERTFRKVVAQFANLQLRINRRV